MSNRRTFLKGCCAGIAALCGSRITNLSFAQGPANGRDILISVFLRGGMDGLNFLVPYEDPDYYYHRYDLALGSEHVLDVDGFFGLHPSAAPLKELYDQGHLALIHACGLPFSNRSHFDAQDIIERGQGENGRSNQEGWLARHLNWVPIQSMFDGVSFGSSVAASLDSFSSAVSLSRLRDFSLHGDWAQLDDIRRSLRSMYQHDPSLSDVALSTLDVSDLLESQPTDEYVPIEGVEYPNGGFGRSLTSLAQLIKLELGLQVATIDLGGWDTHQGQNYNDPTQGHFASLVNELSLGLNNFWNDMVDYHGRITVVAMSEFGRRARENNNSGTDHGHGGVMMVLSSDITQKKVWGTWPGLASELLFERVDLDVTTDYRTVLSEILLTRMKQQNLHSIFPGFSFQQPLGIFGVETSVDRWIDY